MTTEEYPAVTLESCIQNMLDAHECYIQARENGYHDNISFGDWATMLDLTRDRLKKYLREQLGSPSCLKCGTPFEVK